MATKQTEISYDNRLSQEDVDSLISRRQDADRVGVQLPGVQDTAEAKRMIGATATLEYRAVVDGNAQDAIDSGRIPPEAKVYQPRAGGGPILLTNRVIVTGHQLVGPRAGSDVTSGPPARIGTCNHRRPALSVRRHCPSRTTP
ncbi:hypothetical protein BU225_20965, partial [Stenotrophomonas sp. MB339]